MDFASDFYLFLASVVLISLSGVLMPGPLFAVTLQKASKSKIAGVLIALGHGIVEFPLMFVIYFVLSQFEIPLYAQVAVGLVGGLLMIFMGIQTFRNRHKAQEIHVTKRDSLLAGVLTTAANAGFILWWLTIGTTLILKAQELSGFIGFSVFTGVHWLCDFVWYAVVALLIFKSQRFLTERSRQWITLFCVVVFVGFGIFFFVSAISSLIV